MSDQKRFTIHENDAGTEAYQDHYVHDLQAENERLKQENSCMRLESKYLVDLDDGLPLVLDFCQIEKDCLERDKFREENERLRAFAKRVWLDERVPANLHDAAAKILDEPSLAHGADDE